MKKNNVIKKILVLMAVAFTASQTSRAQSYNMAEIRFPLMRAALEKYKLEDNDLLELNYKILISTNRQLLNFGQVNIGVNIPQGGYTEGSNLIIFYSSEPGGKIQAYKMTSYTTPESRKLLKAVEQKLGKPAMDQGKGNRFRVWEDEKKQIIYLMEYGLASIDNKPKVEFTTLMAIDKKAADLVKRRLSGGFQYYGDYRKEKETKKGKFTFIDFLKQKKAEGALYYLDGDHTLTP